MNDFIVFLCVCTEIKLKFASIIQYISGGQDFITVSQTIP